MALEFKKEDFIVFKYGELISGKDGMKPLSYSQIQKKCIKVDLGDNNVGYVLRAEFDRVGELVLKDVGFNLITK